MIWDHCSSDAFTSLSSYWRQKWTKSPRSLKICGLWLVLLFSERLNRNLLLRWQEECTIVWAMLWPSGYLPRVSQNPVQITIKIYLYGKTNIHNSLEILWAKFPKRISKNNLCAYLKVSKNTQKLFWDAFWAEYWLRGPTPQFESQLCHLLALWLGVVI